MQFTTYSFIIFFVLVVFSYYVIPIRIRKIWLLGASYIFYMGWNVKYALLMLASTLVTYACGYCMGYTFKDSQTKKKIALIANIVINLGLLIFFKYFNFLFDSIGTVTSLFGLRFEPTRLDIVLPVGISFYTFQALGYTIDVYKEKTSAERNIITYALFVSFFPQLVAGPIERSDHLLTQLKDINKPRKELWNFDKVTRGLILMIWGFFLKMVIADRAAILVDNIFKHYYMVQGSALLVAIVLFTFQIYCDFNAYSSIAIGAAKVMGVDLMDNFAAPLLSSSISEFWRRWHISLNQWMTDYIYIPLGGGKCSKIKKYRNILITFFVSGLWHGANWTYVIWGLLQGIIVVIENITFPLLEKANRYLKVRTNSIGFRLSRIGGTFILTNLSFIIFRAETVGKGLYYLERMITSFDIWSFFDEAIYTYGLDEKEMHILMLSLALLILVDLYYQKRRAYIDTLVKNQCLVIQYIMVIALLVSVIVFGVYGGEFESSQFIYFQF